MASLVVSVSGSRGQFAYRWDFSTPLSGVTGIFGPSGAGKTSLLRVIAGLDSGAEGRIAMGDRVWLDSAKGLAVPVHRRKLGYVFQEGRLLPHLNVEGNLRFAARRASTAADRFAEIVDGLELRELLHRDVSVLSGGERQRVAIARALMTEPALMIMDEPLSANDIARRQALLPYLRRVVRTFAIPTLYVSHSLDEIATLTDNLLVCRSGKIVAQGPTEALLRRSDLTEVSEGWDAGAVLVATVASIDEPMEVAHLALGTQCFAVPSQGLAEGEEVRLNIHATDIALALEPPKQLSIRNILPSEVLQIDDPGVGTYANVLLATAGGQLRSRVTRLAITELRLKEGMPCYALIKAAAVEKHPALSGALAD